MKLIKLLFAATAALFICFPGSAAPVGTNDAARAVRAWVRRGGTLGARLGQDVTSVGIHATTNGVKFYSVRTLGGGTVFTSADDALEPILAFTPGPRRRPMFRTTKTKARMIPNAVRPRLRGRILTVLAYRSIWVSSSRLARISIRPSS